VSDAPPAQPVAPTQTGHTSYKCPQCGAAQSLQPGAESLACAHCGHQVRIDAPTKPIHEHDFNDALARVRRGPATDAVKDSREVQCKQCGARSVTTQHANRCAFCDEPLVVEIPAAADAILPDAVLPFVIEKGDATKRFQKWLSSRWFAPNDLQRRAKKDGMDGIYVPYWSYDSDTTTRYTGARGEHYYEEESYRDSQGNQKTRRVRKTRWWPASGTVHERFDDVLVSASKGMPRKRLAQLEPWKVDECKPFDGAYLAGFIAERYSLDLGEGFKEAEQIMERAITQAVRRDIGGDEQRVHNMDVRHKDVRFKHLLLPVWVSAFKYDAKVFRVVLNARTGEVAGDRPWSIWKIVLFVLAICAVIAGIVYLIVRAKQPDPAPEPPPTQQHQQMPPVEQSFTFPSLDGPSWSPAPPGAGQRAG
jgi:DNA-directed RNA polymerase subunit RPC12/RpoP